MTVEKKKVPTVSEERQSQPGLECRMRQHPKFYSPSYLPSMKLHGKVALVTGGDSGIGRSVAIHYALEGAHVAIVCLPSELDDARETERLCRMSVEELCADLAKYEEFEDVRLQAGRLQYVRCPPPKISVICKDISTEQNCREIVEHVISEFGWIDIIVNNAAIQHFRKGLDEIDQNSLMRMSAVNVFPIFFLAKYALHRMRPGSTIINSSSVVAFTGHRKLIDYAATKGAIESLTASLSLLLTEKGIRVNSVAPGPVFTSIIPATYPKEEITRFGESVPMGRYAQPCEIAPSYVFLASNDSSYISGQTIHVNGGVTV